MRLRAESSLLRTFDFRRLQPKHGGWEAAVAIKSLKIQLKSSQKISKDKNGRTIKDRFIFKLHTQLSKPFLFHPVIGTLTGFSHRCRKKILAKLFGAFHAALGTNMLPGLDFTRKSNAQKRSNIFFEMYLLEMSLEL